MSPEAVLAEIDSQLQHYAKNMGGADWEDAAQEGRIVALRAMDSYQDVGGLSLAGWCWLRAKGGVIDYLRTHGARRRPWVSLDEMPFLDPGDPGDDLAAVEARIFLRDFVPNCSPAEQETIKCLLLGMSQREAAAARGVTDGAIGQNLGRIRERAAGKLAPYVAPARRTRSAESLREDSLMRFRDDRLSREQVEIVQDLADGKSAVAIAEQRCISRAALKTRIGVIARRLGLDGASQISVVAECFRAGIVD